MLINVNTILGIDRALNLAWQAGLERATPNHELFTHMLESETETEVYPWLANIRGIREAKGDKEYQNVVQKEYELTNREWEGDLSVKATKIKDDQYGMYSAIATQLGMKARKHPGKLVYDFVNTGHLNNGFDGVPFFGAHQMGSQTYSNDLGGAGEAWYLIDASNVVKPLLLQMREDWAFYMATNVADENVRRHKVFEWEAYARYAVGYGYWQYMFKSRLPLTDVNLADAMAEMGELKDEHGEPLDVTPTHLLVPSRLRLEAQKLVNATTVEQGGENMQAGTVGLIVSNYVRTL